MMVDTPVFNQGNHPTMPTDNKPLFRPDAIRPKLTGFLFPDRCEASSQKLTSSSRLLGSKQAEQMK
jgi:hypothetical protein